VGTDRTQADPRPEAEREPEADARPRVFPCEGCGADLEFAIDVQDLRCPYCGFTKAIATSVDRRVEERDYHGALARIAGQRRLERAAPSDVVELRCEACGANVRFVGTLTASECAYCGAPIQRDGVHEAVDDIPVDGVLPFQVDERRAAANLRKWVGSRWFAPNEFLRRGAEGKFAGVYLPFWTFDTLTLVDYSGERGEHYWVTERRDGKEHRTRHTRWYPASGSFRRFFDDVLVVAGRGLPERIMGKLEPWPLVACRPFGQGLLAGYFARTWDVPLDKGFAEAKGRIDRELRGDVTRRIGGDEQRIHAIRTDYAALTYKHLLLPVWLLVYRYEAKPYHVVVNAATGEVQGQRPYSFAKILLAVALALAAIGAVVAVRTVGAG
jgi:DNA-directed RNA polymerase subunit RPC12/RpoP